MTENYYPFCPMNKAIEFATNQPNVNYTGSHQVGINGCNVDTNSELKYTKISKPACKISLLQRPYLTVPYLGKGIFDQISNNHLMSEWCYHYICGIKSNINVVFFLCIVLQCPECDYQTKGSSARHNLKVHIEVVHQKVRSVSLDQLEVFFVGSLYIIRPKASATDTILKSM